MLPPIKCIGPSVAYVRADWRTPKRQIKLCRVEESLSFCPNKSELGL